MTNYTLKPHKDKYYIECKEGDRVWNLDGETFTKEAAEKRIKINEAWDRVWSISEKK